MDLKEVGFEDANWLQLVQDRAQWRVLVNTAMKHFDP
jgi:hypothetical protein